MAFQCAGGPADAVAVFSFLTLLVLLVCAFAVRELRALAGILPDLEQAARSGMDAARGFLLELADRSPRSLRPLLRENVAGLFTGSSALTQQGISRLLSLAGGFLSHIPGGALTLGTALISGCMISARMPRIRRWLLRRIPRQRLETIVSTLKRLRHTAAGWLLAQCKLMGVTFLILLPGFWLLRIPHPLLWAAGVCLVDAFPILGTGTVLLPWALILLLQKDTARAIGLLGLYATVSLSRSILEPRLLGRHLGLDPLVTLMALYAGYQLWGVGGMLLAPLLAVTAVQLLPQKEEP